MPLYIPVQTAAKPGRLTFSINRCYHRVLSSNIPPLGSILDDSARCFLYLLNEFSDRNVMIVVSACWGKEHKP